MRTTSQSRKRFKQFLLSVAAVHVVAIALYYSLGIPRAPMREQRLFAWAWMAVTVVVIVVGLQRIKRGRRERLRPPPASQ